MENPEQAITTLRRADREARVPREPADPLIARLDHAILSLGALPARPRFHAEVQARAGLGRHHFPEHPARRLDPSPYGVLAALAGKGMPGPSSIAVRLGLSPSTVSHHLRRLAARGLVERRPYSGDRRWSNVWLTPAGREAYETIRDARHEALASILASWRAEDREQLVGIVARLGDAVRAHNLRDHERELERRRQAAGRRSPEQREADRRLARERYARRRAADAAPVAARDATRGRHHGRRESGEWRDAALVGTDGQ